MMQAPLGMEGERITGSLSECWNNNNEEEEDTEDQSWTRITTIFANHRTPLRLQ